MSRSTRTPNGTLTPRPKPQRTEASLRSAPTTRNRRTDADPQIPTISKAKRTADSQGRDRSSSASLKPTSNPRSPRTHTSFRRWMTLVLLLSLAGGIAWGGTWVWRVTSAQRLVAQLDSLPTSEIEWQVAKLRVLGATGRKSLVQSLVHERDEVRQASRRQLLQEIDSWKTLDTATGIARVVELAEQLVVLLPSSDRATRRFISNLATDLLLWPTEEGANETPRLLAACETLLRAGFETSGETEDLSEPDPARVADSGSLIPRQPDLPDAVDPWELAQLAGGGLPISPSETPGILPEVAPQPLDWSQTAAIPLPLPGATETQNEAEAENGVSSPPDLDQGTRLDQSPVVPAIDPRWLAQASHFELFRRLHTSDSLANQWVAEELRERGFTQEMIELGTQLAHPDPAERIKAVTTIRRGVRFDSLAWLKMAAKDQDLAVRRLALEGLIETRDPTESRLARRQLQELDGTPLLR